MSFCFITNLSVIASLDSSIILQSHKKYSVSHTTCSPNNSTVERGQPNIIKLHRKKDSKGSVIFPSRLYRASLIIHYFHTFITFTLLTQIYTKKNMKGQISFQLSHRLSKCARENIIRISLMNAKKNVDNKFRNEISTKTIF